MSEIHDVYQSAFSPQEKYSSAKGRYSRNLLSEKAKRTCSKYRFILQNDGVHLLKSPRSLNK